MKVPFSRIHKVDRFSNRAQVAALINTDLLVSFTEILLRSLLPLISAETLSLSKITYFAASKKLTHPMIRGMMYSDKDIRIQGVRRSFSG